MAGVAHLLYPEWQGFGVNAAVQDGALAAAAALFPDASFTRIDAPREEAPASSGGVLGLTSIAARFRTALDHLRTTAPNRVVTVGGTCGVEAAPIAYLNERVASAVEHLCGVCAVVGFSLVEYVDRGGTSMTRLRRLTSALRDAIGPR